MQVSQFLRKAATGYIHFCPACSDAHMFTTEGATAWTFNGDVERPSFSPSMLIRWGRFADPSYKPEPGEDDLSGTCHYFLKVGQLAYCSDSTHELAGKTVPLPELPEWMRDDRYGDGNP
jgi:hypothetical protein